jgi:hypothetical protein
MAWSSIVNVSSFVWGLVVVQGAADAEEFEGIISQWRLSDDARKTFIEVYDDNAIAGGFCAALPHPMPWLICVFATEWNDIQRVALHEFVHLGEDLPNIRNGTPLSKKTAELRANITSEAYMDFLAADTVYYNQAPSRPSAQTSNQETSWLDKCCGSLLDPGFLWALCFGMALMLLIVRR